MQVMPRVHPFVPVSVNMNHVHFSTGHTGTHTHTHTLNGLRLRGAFERGSPEPPKETSLKSLATPSKYALVTLKHELVLFLERFLA